MTPDKRSSFLRLPRVRRRSDLPSVLEEATALEADPSNPTFILTDPGVGYRFIEPEPIP